MRAAMEAVGEEDACGKKRKNVRWKIPPETMAALEEAYAADRFPTAEARAALAASLEVAPRQVQVWFQNKRQRTKVGALLGVDDGALVPSSESIVPTKAGCPLRRAPAAPRTLQRAVR